MKLTSTLAIAVLFAVPVAAYDVRVPTPLTRSEVERTQRALDDLGYSLAAVDGRIGANTRQAVRDFQRDHNLNATGELNVETRQAIDDVLRARDTHAAAPARRVDEATVRRVQRRLSELGYPVKGADGEFGPETRTALRNYQRDKNLNATGDIDDETLSSLDADSGATSGTRR